MPSLVLAGALLALAPAAATQAFVPVTGAPIAYRVSIPADWEVSTIDEGLTAGNADVMLMIMTMDMLVGDDGAPLSAAELRSRRRRSEEIVASDSLLLELASKHIVSDEEYTVGDLTKGIGTLGGQRAGYARAHLENDKGAHWALNYATVREGIMYGFVFVWRGEDREAHDPLFARIRDSFVFPDAPRP
ncbi:MAG TPA: hypothetical protein VFT45_17530 [Longimicrobium sp.]|nr:hypothetical protein [Longimicrobium sp.]